MRDLLKRFTPGKHFQVTEGPRNSNDGQFVGQDDSLSEIVYLQSQNGNLLPAAGDTTSEFGGICGDVLNDIPWATEALGKLTILHTSRSNVAIIDNRKGSRCRKHLDWRPQKRHQCSQWSVPVFWLLI